MRATRAVRRCYSSPLMGFSFCYTESPIKLQVRHGASIGNLQFKIYAPTAVKIRNLGLGPTSKDFEEPSQISGPMTKVHATELVLHLNDEERKMLFNALQEYESNRIKEEFEDKLAGQRWRSKLGRPSKVPTLGDVDPTGTYCPVPEDWLKKKYAATVPKPTTKELFHLSLANSIPFIGFGFLDNFIMIIAVQKITFIMQNIPVLMTNGSEVIEKALGDSIESSMSAYITLSTMAAAALGNTFSDIIGIGSSYYVERAATMVGLGAPGLSPVQLDMPISRRFANMGRVLGITLGCFLGMIPLLFKDGDKKPETK